jgi:hypothetical protein
LAAAGGLPGGWLKVGGVAVPRVEAGVNVT